MDGKLLPWFLECQLASAFRCQFCGRSGQAIGLRKPLIHRSDAEIRVYYPARCLNCNKVSGFGLRMSILLFGFLLAWCKLYAGGRRRNDSTEKCVTPCKAETFAQICDEFSRILAQHGGSVAGPPSDTDRIQFGLTPEEWNEFSQRLGYGEEGKKNDK